jgi:hypothetical protein
MSIVMVLFQFSEQITIVQETETGGAGLAASTLRSWLTESPQSRGRFSNLGCLELRRKHDSIQLPEMRSGIDDSR